MHRLLTALVVLLLATGPVTAHLFNHEGRDVACDIWGPPEHSLGDGHVHTHDADEAARMSLHDHDPCKQTGMAYPAWPAADPLAATTLAGALIGDVLDEIPYLAQGEAYVLPFDRLTEQTNLVAVGDGALAAQGFPGSGTADDPYIIEGYLIRNVLQLKDTHACVVIRNNVIHSNAVPGELIDPADILMRIDELVALQQRIDAARSELESLLAQQAAWTPTLDALAIELDAYRAERSDLRAQLNDLAAREAAYRQAQQEEAAEQDALQRAIDRLETEATGLGRIDDQARVDLAAARTAGEAAQGHAIQAALRLDELTVATQELHEAFAAYQTSQDRPAPEPPAEDRLGLLAYMQHAAQMAQQDAEQEWLDRMDVLGAELETALAAHQSALGAIDAARDQQVHHAATSQQALEDLTPVQAELDDLLAELELRRSQETPPEDAQLKEERRILDERWSDFRNRFQAFGAERANLLDQHAGLQNQAANQAAAIESMGLDADALARSIEEFPLAYLGDLYRDLDEILAAVLASIDEPEDGAGRLILDWNGQCIHAYNNVIEDLRVNRNNDRLGYATGGIIEQNRIGVVGQIRHYDGIFRHNEVGDRAHLDAMLDPGMTQPASERAVNTDGFNQGWMHDNIIYGSIDLDFHGHHHGGGFFAPVSHYHGSLVNVAYMYDSATGECKYVAPGDMPTPEERLGMDNVVSVPDSRCLAHWNHGLRWTSVKFQDNTIIDPLGVGLRYEDRNHRGDDEQANSENMEELKVPHTHQTHIDMSGNAIVGTLRVDVFNADGTDLWSDDWSEVQSDGTGRILDAVLHLGAQIVNSHPERNNGWLDIHDNLVLLHADGRSAAIHVHDAKEMDRLAILGNQAMQLGSGFASGLDHDGFLAWLDGANADDVEAWGGAIGPATGILLQRIQDSTIQICDNAFHGFTRGLQATQMIQDDVTIQTCQRNEWGSADPRIDVRFSPAPQPEPRTTQPVQDVTDGTIAREATRPIYDAIESNL